MCAASPSPSWNVMCYFIGGWGLEMVQELIESLGTPKIKSGKSAAWIVNVVALKCVSRFPAAMVREEMAFSRGFEHPSPGQKEQVPGGIQETLRACLAPKPAVMVRPWLPQSRQFTSPGLVPPSRKKGTAQSGPAEGLPNSEAKMESTAQP